MHLNKTDIENTPRIKRLNIINTITGIKPGNLIGSSSEKTGTNLAVFSSVVHLGSSPAMLGFILRPTSDVPRNTYENIMESGEYTINHIHTSFTKKAHYTSAKFDASISEFEACNLTEEYIPNFTAPFVKESPLKIGMKFLEEIPIKRNGTTLIIGEVQHLILPDDQISEEGYIDLSAIGSTGIGGLNRYYSLGEPKTYPFARPTELPNFEEK